MDSKRYGKRRAQIDQSQCKVERKTDVAAQTPTTPIAITILNVNNDCLEKVFDLLSLEDLLNLADSNTYLRSSVLPVLRRKLKFEVKVVEIDISSNFVHSTIFDDVIAIRKPLAAFKTLRLFGQEIKYLSMDNAHRFCNKLSWKIKDYVCEYCSDSLVSLEVVIGPDVKATKPFTKLETLSITRTAMCISNFNESFPVLRRLILNQYRARPSWVPIMTATKFNQLEELSVDNDTAVKHVSSDVRKLVKLNRGLRCLSLATMGSNDWKLLKFVSRHLKHLETLDF